MRMSFCHSSEFLRPNAASILVKRVWTTHLFLINHNSLKYISRFITAANDVQFDCYKPSIYSYAKIELRTFLFFDSREKISITFSLYLFPTKMHSCRTKKKYPTNDGNRHKCPLENVLDEMSPNFGPSENVP
jgi:hypothetical protein